MAKKKLYTSVTAGAFIASSLFIADQVDASTYKVQPGDTLWNIARDHQTSVADLKTINHLTSDIIFPNQTIQITLPNDKGSESTTSKNDTTPTETTKSSTYTVKRGDTLSGIALSHGITLTDLMAWNELETTLIYPGNVLVVDKKSANDQSSSQNSSGNSTGVKYTVKAGDSLSVIGREYGVSVADLKRWNNLTSDLIIIGQTLKVAETDGSQEEGKAPEQGNSANPDNGSAGNGNDSSAEKGSIHVVERGDTLSGIAKKYGVTVQEIKKWNYLGTDLIIIGEKLIVNEKQADNNGNTGSSGSGSSNSGVDALIDEAKNLLGTGYVWGGNTPSGFDCSGYIYYTFNRAGVDLPRLSTEGYYNRSYYVDQPQVGDLVFFENTYKQGISHMGIYLGNDEFIHAGSSGVVIANLSSSYWQKHYDGFKRFY